MNRLLMIAMLISILFTACDKGDDTKEDVVDVRTEEIFAKYGIKPSDPKSINNIEDVISEDGYKLAFGKKLEKAWVAKFKSNGDEIFSYVLENEATEVLKYSHCNASSKLLIDDDKLFLSCYLTDSDQPSAPTNGFSAVLVVIDLNQGVEISRVKSIKEKNAFKNLRKEEGFYFTESADWYDGGPTSNFYVFNLDGTVLWQRNTVAGFEYDGGIKAYYQNFFLDAFTIVYCNFMSFDEANGYHIYSGDKTCVIKSVNLKEHDLIFEKRVALAGDDKDLENVVYTNISISNSEGKTKIQYREKQISTDNVSGNKTFEFLGEYYINISSTTGEELNRGKLN
ncbi:hypothetical protein L3073_11115 [Ancylomarina sp. DW003]|nr:hypothetical protein [Ancylomarina sp. DW003]MDE5422758.1 hypothetical protein [Ancylomarina sp. DW003]